ncbi:ABC transporter periplasmic protein [Brochothrix thermosphacta DSM 20171 = FSL F6-1036]|nr:ABC transporter periplasmic protein [Brochothrix thermosphacta DSM 20171 = FSL F6-1036]
MYRVHRKLQLPTKKKNVETIIVGTGTQYPGICFIDENGKLTGYDIEVIRAIDKKITAIQL